MDLAATYSLAHNLIHIICAELHNCPRQVLKNIRVTMNYPIRAGRAGILRRRTILIEINELTVPPMPCSQSYQQNMGTTFACLVDKRGLCIALFLSFQIFLK